MPFSYKIKGGKKLKGTVEISGSKNAILPCMASALLTKGKTVLYNVSHIEEVHKFVKVFQSMGVKIDFDENIMIIDTTGEINPDNMDKEIACKTRVVLYLIGALAHKFTNFKIPFSGGCNLGKRSVEAHLDALNAVDINIDYTNDHYIITNNGLKGKEFVMYESGDTATANAVIASVLAEGTTTIKLASGNYMIQDVCYMLKEMGAKITGIGSPTLIIEGVKELKPINYFVMPDPIEAMTFISIGATSNSNINIKKCPLNFLELELCKLRKMGWNYEITKKYNTKDLIDKDKLNQNELEVFKKHKEDKLENRDIKTGDHPLIDIETFESKLKALPDKIHSALYPGINVDNLPFFVPIATQAEGTTLVHDWMFDGRAKYYIELNKLGADISMTDPHRVFVKGKTTLKPARIDAPPALRPSVMIVVGMIATDGGECELRHIAQITRGYERFEKKLKDIGVDIEKIETASQ